MLGLIGGRIWRGYRSRSADDQLEYDTAPSPHVSRNIADHPKLKYRGLGHAGHGWAHLRDLLRHEI